MRGYQVLTASSSIDPECEHFYVAVVFCPVQKPGRVDTLLVRGAVHKKTHILLAVRMQVVHETWGISLYGAYRRQGVFLSNLRFKIDFHAFLSSRLVWRSLRMIQHPWHGHHAASMLTSNLEGDHASTRQVVWKDLIIRHSRVGKEDLREHAVSPCSSWQWSKHRYYKQGALPLERTVPV
ncbi:hypothetical protein PLICRDRAFT_400333 [Plicaturopsis crispa FD-325 SS-3]|nr:hypothetical protein PLICRDRAFT_400333 [Plicaturopsis crispa FD-325 SS-3]